MSTSEKGDQDIQSRHLPPQKEEKDTEWEKAIDQLPKEIGLLIIAIKAMRMKDLKGIILERFDGLKTEEGKNRFYPIISHFPVEYIRYIDCACRLDWVRVVEGPCSLETALFAYSSRGVSISSILGDFKVNKGSNWGRGFEILQMGKSIEGKEATEIAVYLVKCIVCKVLDSNPFIVTVNLMMNLYALLEGRSDLNIHVQEGDVADILKAICNSDMTAYLYLIKKSRG